ncbi:hypothetical protein [Lyngbya aestuarii]|uniref:hypothetical protein n=1 Tax=Lyngbya aestuarii TaxID=118322 RepID=UPI00403DDEBB
MIRITVQFFESPSDYASYLRSTGNFQPICTGTYKVCKLPCQGSYLFKEGEYWKIVRVTQVLTNIREDENFSPPNLVDVVRS